MVIILILKSLGFSNKFKGTSAYKEIAIINYWLAGHKNWCGSSITQISPLKAHSSILPSCWLWKLWIPQPTSFLYG